MSASRPFPPELQKTGIISAVFPVLPEGGLLSVFDDGRYRRKCCRFCATQSVCNVGFCAAPIYDAVSKPVSEHFVPDPSEEIPNLLCQFLFSLLEFVPPDVEVPVCPVADHPGRPVSVHIPADRLLVIIRIMALDKTKLVCYCVNSSFACRG